MHTQLSERLYGHGSDLPLQWHRKLLASVLEQLQISLANWLGGGCIGGLAEYDCKAGWHKFLSMCYIDLPPGFSGGALDPIKDGTYSRIGTLPNCEIAAQVAKKNIRSDRQIINQS